MKPWIKTSSGKKNKNKNKRDLLFKVILYIVIKRQCWCFSAVFLCHENETYTETINHIKIFFCITAVESSHYCSDEFWMLFSLYHFNKESSWNITWFIRSTFISVCRFQGSVFLIFIPDFYELIYNFRLLLCFICASILLFAYFLFL